MTEEQRCRRRLAVAEQELHLILGSARAGTWEIDLRTFQNKWSEETWRLYGLDPTQVMPSTEAWTSSIAPEDRKRIKQATLDALTRRVDIEIEWQVNLADEDRWLMARGQPVIEADGSIERYVGVVIDITAQKLLEQAATQRASELKAILDALPVGVARIDRSQRYTFANRVYETYFGDSPIELIGKSVEGVIGKTAMAYAMPKIQLVLTGEPQSFENRIPFADGKLHTLLVKLVPDQTLTGKTLGYYVVSADITDMRAREAEMEAMRGPFEDLSRLQIAQQTIVAVAHELRQPLHAATVFAEVARKELEKSPQQSAAGHAITRASEEIVRTSQLLGGLFDLIRGNVLASVGEMKPIDLNELLSTFVATQLSRYPCKLACLEVVLDDIPANWLALRWFWTTPWYR